MYVSRWVKYSFGYPKRFPGSLAVLYLPCQELSAPMTVRSRGALQLCFYIHALPISTLRDMPRMVSSWKLGLPQPVIPSKSFPR